MVELVVGRVARLKFMQDTGVWRQPRSLHCFLLTVTRVILIMLLLSCTDINFKNIGIRCVKQTSSLSAATNDYH